MRSCKRFVIAALVAAVPASFVLAQELSVDVNSLDVPGAASKPVKQKGATKAQNGATKAAGGKQGKAGKSDDRQFGELEGWSPGKSPPGKKDAPDEPEGPFGGGKTPLTLSPSGNMAIGLPF